MGEYGQEPTEACPIYAVTTFSTLRKGTLPIALLSPLHRPSVPTPTKARRPVRGCGFRSGLGVTPLSSQPFLWGFGTPNIPIPTRCQRQISSMDIRLGTGGSYTKGIFATMGHVPHIGECALGQQGERLRQRGSNPGVNRM